jgi:DNA polymerase
LDARYETIGAAVRLEGEDRSTFIDGPDVPAYLGSIDPATTTTVAFNAMFDSAILAWRYNFVPARIMCTMRMAVAQLGYQLPSHSLAKVGELLGVGTKGTILGSARGKHRADLVGDPEFWRAYQSYACNDNDMSRAIFYKLIKSFPSPERRIMDRVMRCAIVPRFVVDKPMLQQHLIDLKELQAQLLIDAGAATTMDAGDRAERLEEFATTLRSNAKFEKVLKERGVEVIYKDSTTDPERKIPAFAKTDSFMTSLQDHEDVEVQALAAARLGLRSTIEETRGRRILDIANLNWPGYCHGNLPVPLKYAAAHTHRLGGDWSINLQNLPSGRGGKTSKLRKALCAPAGHKVVVCDKSQVEARITAHVCQQHNLLDLFHDRKDPYAFMARYIFGYDIDKNTHPFERFVGKTSVLGLGYGCGPDRFHAMVTSQARQLGIDMSVLNDMWSPQRAADVVKTYRRVFPNIARIWKVLDGVLATTWATGTPHSQMFGPVQVTRGCVEGPGDLKMTYGAPHFDTEDQEYTFTYAGRRHKMYGAKFLENIVQFLARVNIMHDALRISDRGFDFCHQSHDELVFIVPDDRVDECLTVALEEMRRPPSWAPGIPLDAEGSYGQSYGSAKT